MRIWTSLIKTYLSTFGTWTFRYWAHIHIEHIMIEWGLKFNLAFSCCILDEHGVSKLLEVSSFNFKVHEIAHVPSDLDIATPPLLQGPPIRLPPAVGSGPQVASFKIILSLLASLNPTLFTTTPLICTLSTSSMDSFSVASYGHHLFHPTYL